MSLRTIDFFGLSVTYRVEARKAGPTIFLSLRSSDGVHINGVGRIYYEHKGRISRAPEATGMEEYVRTLVPECLQRAFDPTTKEGRALREKFAKDLPLAALTVADFNRVAQSMKWANPTKKEHKKWLDLLVSKFGRIPFCEITQEKFALHMLIGWIESNLTNMFTDVNEKVGTIAAEVGQTPSGWNGGVYQMIRGLSENVIVPIAGIIITFVLCYELISMITEKNNLHDMDTWMFFKWFFKAAVAIYLVTHTFDIVMAVFDIGQNVVSGAAGVIHGNTSIDIDATIAQMRTGMENMGVGELLGLSIETLLISLCLKIMAILITVILYGRMIEIYCTVSIAPIPIATMSNREWGSIGTNYLKGLFALAFQGFLIMVCVGIYAVLINGMIIADNIHSALFSVAAYTVILCFSLFKTGSLAKSIFHAH